MRGGVGDTGLGPLLEGNLAGNVGTRKGATVDTKEFADSLGKEMDARFVHINTFDAGDTAGVRKNLTLNLLAGLDDELMGQVENEKRAVLDRILQGGVGVQVDRQLNSWKILDVLVNTVNHLSQLLRAGIGGIVVL